MLQTCNFILGTSGKIKYPLLVDALIDILNVFNQIDIHRKGGATENKEKITYIWIVRDSILLFHMLGITTDVTSFDSLYKFALDEEIPAGSILLHSLIWDLRTAYKTFIG